MDFKKIENRLQFRFWLDVERPDENSLAEYVNRLKEKRRFAQTIRDALCLIRDLRQGRVEVLLSLFPWIEDYFAKPNSQSVTVSLPDPIREHLEKMEQYFRQLPSQMVDQSPQKVGKPLMLVEPALDPEDTIEIKRVQGGKGDWNGLISMAALLGSYEQLTPEIIEYGVQIGRIPSHVMKNRVLPAKKTEQGGAPKKMDVPQFAAPTFDDDDEPFEIIKQ